MGSDARSGYRNVKSYLPLSAPVVLLDELLPFLEGLSHDPIIYSIVFFIYTIAATIILPIPVEIGLFFSAETPIIIKALILGTGKALGSVMIFALGGKISGGAYRLFSKNIVLRAFMNAMRWFVLKTRYFGLYVILSTPLMVDTVPIYLFSLFNQKGLMNIRYFALTNFLAGTTRAAVVYIVFLWLGFKLV